MHVMGRSDTEQLTYRYRYHSSTARWREGVSLTFQWSDLHSWPGPSLILLLSNPRSATHLHSPRSFPSLLVPPAPFPSRPPPFPPPSPPAPPLASTPIRIELKLPKKVALSRGSEEKAEEIKQIFLMEAVQVRCTSKTRGEGVEEKKTGRH